jgi:hypothetical protein
MAWLRIDDGFTANAKITQLTDTEFRVWVRLLCYCASVQDPTVDRITKREVSGLQKSRIQRFFELRLLDSVGDSLEIHDWAHFLPKDATSHERQARWRARNSVTRPVTPTVTETVTPTVTPSVTQNGPPTVTETVTPHARGHARTKPVPQDQNPPTDTETVVNRGPADGLGSGNGLEPIGPTVKTELAQISPDDDIDF